MSSRVQEEIRELRTRFWSENDPAGRAFAPLADAYRRAGELDEAADLVRDGLRRLPRFAPGHLVAARVFRDRGQREEAFEAFRRVLDLDAENVEALRGAAALADEDGHVGQALALFQRLARLESDDDEVLERIRELKRHHFVAEADEQPEGVDGEETDPYTRTMADLYARQGHIDRAREIYQHLLASSPDDEELERRLRELGGEPGVPAGESGSERAGATGGERAGEPGLPAGAGGSEPEDQLGGDTAWAPAGVPGDQAGRDPAAGTDEHDDRWEMLATEWANGPDAIEDMSTPFAWSGGTDDDTLAEEIDDSGPSIASYFRELLEWPRRR